MMLRHVFSICLSLLFMLTLSEAVCAQKETPKGNRRVFVLHSGMHIILSEDDKNLAVKVLKAKLIEHGIAERDIVALDCPFPDASINDMVPRAGLLTYLESADPASRSSHDGYLRMHKALQAQGVTKTDNLVWIGHSAGGQMGMSMAHLAHNFDKQLDLQKKAQPYRFEMVITLGSAVGSNPVPADVKLRHYYSPADLMLYFLSKHGNLVSGTMKSKVRFCPCFDLQANGLVRVFADVEHPAWYWTPAVLDCVLNEFRPNICPAWRRTQADTGQGLGLAQLLAKGLEAECRIGFEENRP